MFDPPGAGSGQDSENEAMAITRGRFTHKAKRLQFQLRCKVPRPVLSDR